MVAGGTYVTLLGSKQKLVDSIWFPKPWIMLQENKSVFVHVPGSALLPFISSNHKLCNLWFMVNQAQNLFTVFLFVRFILLCLFFAPLINFTCHVHLTKVSYKVEGNLDLASCKSINQWKTKFPLNKWRVCLAFIACSIYTWIFFIVGMLNSLLFTFAYVILYKYNMVL